MTRISYGCDACTVNVDDTPQPLPSQLTTRYGDPALLGSELLDLIQQRIDAHPRSLQAAVGPSELGTPCVRKLGHKLAGTAPVNVRPGGWLPTIGTAVHAWLEQALQAVNDSHTYDRFYLEQRVHVGDVGGQPVTGACDCYDRVTATVIDWKIVGLDKVRAYRKNGPGEQYRAQAHLYGRGYQGAGLPVDHVAVMFLPRGGDLAGAYYWAEPYDEQVAVDTLTRANGVTQLLGQLGPAALPLLPTADAYCAGCPYFQRGTTDLTVACPGADPTGSHALIDPPASLAVALT